MERGAGGVSDKSRSSTTKLGDAAGRKLEAAMHRLRVKAKVAAGPAGLPVQKRRYNSHQRPCSSGSSSTGGGGGGGGGGGEAECSSQRYEYTFATVD